MRVCVCVSTKPTLQLGQETIQKLCGIVVLLYVSLGGPLHLPLFCCTSLPKDDDKKSIWLCGSQNHEPLMYMYILVDCVFSLLPPSGRSDVFWQFYFYNHSAILDSPPTLFNHHLDVALISLQFVSCQPEDEPHFSIHFDRFNFQTNPNTKPRAWASLRACDRFLIGGEAGMWGQSSGKLKIINLKSKLKS